MADAEVKLAKVAQELKTANARIAELEAEAKKSDATVSDATESDKEVQ